MWDGTERRSMQRYCDGHQELREIAIRTEERIISMDKRINGTVDEVKTHIENSRPRNIAIAGVALTIFIWLFNIAIDLGANKKMIEINTQRWERYLAEQADTHK
jgi:hypothetical protein